MVRRRLFGGKTPEMDRNVGELLLHEEDWDQVDNIIIDVKKQLPNLQRKLRWEWSILVLLLLVFYYFVVVLWCFNYLPKPLTNKEQHIYPNRFIAERAADDLRSLTALGPRVVGSVANEVEAVRYLKTCLNKIRKQTDLSLYDFELDHQIASDSYAIKRMVNMYQGMQNIVVKLSPRSQMNSSSYLLINSHYDSVPGSPGGSDDGAMVVVMLEVLRVISKSPTPLQNPIVFLFNGAEENPLQASHAFITQHKWAKFIKAVINLDSAGSGGREILFQSAPQHPWLMKYFRAAIQYPYVSTVAEELFQSNLIPSDTDFRIFRDYGNVPGLDMAYQQNGFVYHTKFDRSEIIPWGTLQRTGDNVLNLAKALANAPELRYGSEHNSGHTVFFDYLGLFLIFYTETEGVILNALVGFSLAVACLYSVYTMAQSTGLTLKQLLKHWCWAMLMQCAVVIVCLVICMLLAIALDVLIAQMSWFSCMSMVIGLYICPLYASIGLLSDLYVHPKRNKDRMTSSFRLQLLLHSQSVLFGIGMSILTLFRIRSAFLLMIIILCYVMGLIFNLVSKLHNRTFAWMIPHFICITPAFLFYAYICHGFFVTFIPMTGRFGSRVNPELIIGGFAAGTGILTGSLMIPLIVLMKQARKSLMLLLIIGVTCVLVATTTSAGFPFRSETNVKRLIITHSRRTLRDARNDVRSTETGYLLLPLDRRPLTEFGLDLSNRIDISRDCEMELGCGLPVYTYRWYQVIETSVWLKGPDPKQTTAPTLKLISRKDINSTRIRYDLVLNGPDHMSIFIRTLNNETVMDWSFCSEPLQNSWKQPYFIYFSYGVQKDALLFWIEIKKTKTQSNLSKPSLEIGVSGHWNHNDDLHSRDFQHQLDSLPDYVFANAWTATYDNWFY